MQTVRKQEALGLKCQAYQSIFRRLFSNDSTFVLENLVEKELKKIAGKKLSGYEMVICGPAPSEK